MAMEARRRRRARKQHNRRDNIIHPLIQLMLSWRNRLRRQKSWRVVRRYYLRTWRVTRRFNLSWWYWLLSGYGERVARAFGVLLSIWLLFALIYSTGNASWWQPKQPARLAADASARETQPNAGKDAPPAVREAQPTVREAQPAVAATVPLTLPEAVIYSAGVMSLQKPEPLPANKRAKALVLFETILGPLQAALLALAIRRKFMR